MTEKSGLTEIQARILAAIEEGIAHLGRPPTYRDLAKQFGYDAVGTIQDHIRALIRKGYLEKDEGRARGLRLTHRSESIDIPVLGVVPAGRPIEAIEDRIGSLPAPSRLKGEVFALRVQGDSMIEAGILEGDYVIVRKQNHAANGEIVVAMIDGQATVKTLEIKGSRIRLLPANPRYAPIEVPAHAENLIQGKVLSLQRYYGK